MADRQSSTPRTRWDTDAVLAEHGYSMDEIAGFRRAKVI